MLGDEVLLVRVLAVITAVALLSGCIDAEKPTLSADAMAHFRLTDVSVDFTPDAQVHYSDAEDEAANAQTASGESADIEKVKQHQRERASAVIRAAFLSEVGPKLAGSQPVKVRVTVSNFWVPGVLGTVLVGGSANMVAGVDLLDAKSGNLIVGFQPDKGYGGAAAFSGIGGAVINAAMDANTVDGRAGRMARNFADDYAGWLNQR